LGLRSDLSLDATAAAAAPPRARDGQLKRALHPRRPPPVRRNSPTALRARHASRRPPRAAPRRPPRLPIAFSAAVASAYRDSLPALHGLAVASGLDAYAIVTNSLAARYVKAGGSFPSAARVFATARARDASSYNTILSSIPDPDEALAFAARMLRSGDVRPDAVTFTVALSLAAGRREGWARSLAAARKVFEEMPVRDLVSWNALVCGLAQDGDCPAEVIRVFLRMLKDGGGVRPDRISVCSVIPACGGDGKLELGRQMHGFAVKLGVDWHVSIGNVVANSLITMYAKLRRMDDARMVFDFMPRPEIIAWNALISGYAQNEKCEDALEVFSSMVKCMMKPNETTFASVLSAVTAVETVSMAYWPDVPLPDSELGLGASESLIAWTAIISANTKHGNYDAVVSLFNDMVRSGLAPDGVVLLSVLTACRYSGFVSLGREIFDSMAAEHGAELWPEHYACVVDMLGRAGRLEEAEELMLQMPSGPSVSALQSLLGACRIHGNMDVGERVAGVLMETEPTESGAYVLLSNIYAEKGDWARVARVRRHMRERGVKKEVGFSWVDAGGVGESLHLHRFSSDDTTHPMTEEIYRVAEGLGWEMKFLKNWLQVEIEGPV
ncbi:hypothetical protein EJB05_10614, partial [Eragrostis curvula]